MLSQVPIDDTFDLQRHVEESWYQLNNGSNIELPWEQGYWKAFINGDFQPASTALSSFKRAVPVSAVSASGPSELVVQRLKPTANK